MSFCFLSSFAVTTVCVCVCVCVLACMRMHMCYVRKPGELCNLILTVHLHHNPLAVKSRYINYASILTAQSTTDY